MRLKTCVVVGTISTQKIINNLEEYNIFFVVSIIMQLSHSQTSPFTVGLQKKEKNI
jgi:hypothetical protein